MQVLMLFIFSLVITACIILVFITYPNQRKKLKQTKAYNKLNDLFKNNSYIRLVFYSQIIIGFIFSFFIYRKQIGISGFILSLIFGFNYLFVKKFKQANLRLEEILTIFGSLFLGFFLAIRDSNILRSINLFTMLYLNLRLMINIDNPPKPSFKNLLYKFFLLPLHTIGNGITSIPKKSKLKNISGFNFNRIITALTALFITAITSFIFLLLFASADAGFTNISKNLITSIVDFIRFIDIPYNPIDIIIISILTTIFGLSSYGFFVSKISDFLVQYWDRFGVVKEPKKTAKTQTLNLEYLFFSFTINLLFAVFIIVQSSYIFGLKSVAELDLTYSEYARQGFNQLLIVGIISLIIILLSKYFHRKKIISKLGFQISSSILLVQNIIILLSSFYRMTVYEEAYGYTINRFLVYCIIIFTMWVNLITLREIKLHKQSWSSSGLVLLGYMCILLGMNLINLENFITQQNYQNFPISASPEEPIELDTDYIFSLSADNNKYKQKIMDEKLEYLKDNDFDPLRCQEYSTLLQKYENSLNRNKFKSIWETNLATITESQTNLDKYQEKNQKCSRVVFVN